MKPIKVLVFAAMAALTMAFLCASSAMAEKTRLCATDQNPCTSPITHIHEATLAGHKSVIKAGSNTVECDVLLLVTSLEHIKVLLGFLYLRHTVTTYANCSSGCTVKEEGGPSLIEALKLGHETADVAGGSLFSVSCSFISCSYNGEGLLGTAKGPLLSTETNGEVSFVGQKLQEEGEKILCPEESLLTITTTPLSATYITS